MDGQNQDYRPRTAGERRNASGPDGGVRDWQRNTWFGPAPLNNNPFEEPEDAPELKEIRSANVTEHAGDFWNTPEKTIQLRFHPDGLLQTTAETEPEESKRDRARSA